MSSALFLQHACNDLHLSGNSHTQQPSATSPTNILPLHLQLVLRALRLPTSVAQGDYVQPSPSAPLVCNDSTFICHAFPGPRVLNHYLNHLALRPPQQMECRQCRRFQVTAVAPVAVEVRRCSSTPSTSQHPNKEHQSLWNLMRRENSDDLFNHRSHNSHQTCRMVE